MVGVLHVVQCYGTNREQRRPVPGMTLDRNGVAALRTRIATLVHSRAGDLVRREQCHLDCRRRAAHGRRFASSFDALTILTDEVERDARQAVHYAMGHLAVYTLTDRSSRRVNPFVATVRLDGRSSGIPVA